MNAAASITGGHPALARGLIHRGRGRRCGRPRRPARAAIAVSALTHPGPDCADACVLWGSGIRTAVLHGTLDGVRGGLDLLPAERRETAKRLDEAEAARRTGSTATAGPSTRSRPPGRPSPAPPRPN
ncbi:ADP-ribosylglycohydrolase family protein [Streptomyces sp. NBC_00510]